MSKKNNYLDGEDNFAKISRGTPSIASNDRQDNAVAPSQGIFRVEKSKLFGQLDDFLPQMKKANEQLERVSEI